MAYQDLILCIDVGGDSIKAAEFAYSQGGSIVLEKFAFNEYSGETKEGEENTASLADTLRDIIMENGFRAKKVYLSLSGQNAFIRFVKVPAMSDDQQKIRQILEFEARQNIPFPMNEVVWDSQIIKNNDESGAGEIEAMFVTVKNEEIEKITSVMEEVGKEVVLVEVAPTACYNAAVENGVGEKECEMILNIGGRCSTLVFIDNGRFFVRTIPIAGNSVTQQISKEFGISFADAEVLKRRHGFVALGGAYEEPESEVAATVSKIVRNVMTRLHGEINRSINVYRAQQKGRKPEKLYLSGGSSVMAFTPRFFSEKLRIPVEYFNPFKAVGISPDINKEELAEVAHMFSETIGLGLRRVMACQIEISLIPETLKKRHEMKLKMPYFYASAASLLLCLGITYFSFQKQYDVAEYKVTLVKDTVSNLEKIDNKLKTAQGNLESAKREYEKVSGILNERKTWVTLFNGVQDLLPDNMWLTKFQLVATPGGAAQNTVEAPPDMGGGLFGGPRRRQSSSSSSPSSSGILEWAIFEGHSVLPKDNRVSYEDLFMRDLSKSPLFGNDVRPVILETGSGNFNITTFKIEARLAKPIRKQ